MTQAPSAKSLVERFKLKERGRERGRSDLPSEHQPTLDDVETDVVDYCNGLFAEKRDEYSKHRPIFEERMRLPSESRGADALLDQGCKELKDAVAEERPDLEGLARDAQQAIGELNRFKREEGRTADADFPESRRLHYGILATLLVLETLINGIFFGTNVAGGLFGGMSYAVLISAVNVLGLGFLAATMFRYVQHRDSRRKIGGLAILGVVVVVAVFWNLFVAHYREALAEDYPPPPETVTAESSASEQEIAACWRGPDESEADQEALCLFRASPFGFGGFYSYMLLLIGLAMCAFAALDWFKTDDPYPGYGKRERHRRRTEEALSDDRRELLGRVRDMHDDALGRQRGDFVDPVDSRGLALSAFDKLLRRHGDLCSFAGDLEKSCSGALDIYRTANREARSTPEPHLWQKTWISAWPRPERPSNSDLMTEAAAEQRSFHAHAALEERERKLRFCHDECQTLVNDFTRLDPHDKAVPS